MKKDKFKTEVQFLLQPTEDGAIETFAYFPKMYYNKELYKTTFTCYAHIGQHSACHIDYARECKEATREQYLDLQRELEGLGYNLLITNKKINVMQKQFLIYKDIQIFYKCQYYWTLGMMFTTLRKAKKCIDTL